MVIRFGLLLFRLLHVLPLGALAALGRAAGLAFYALGHERRRVALTNLRLCFRQWSEAARRRIARRMNEFIEQRVREMPEQYGRLHKHFKTRPPGEPRPC